MLIPHAEIEEREVSVKHQIIPENLEAALSYTLLLLLDSSKDYGRNLSRCRLPKCRRFFFILRPKTGRARKKYCTTDHMNEAHKAKGPERVRKSRAKKRAKKTKKRTDM